MVKIDSEREIHHVYSTPKDDLNVGKAVVSLGASEQQRLKSVLVFQVPNIKNPKRQAS
jgi:hypothetical protein